MNLEMVADFSDKIIINNVPLVGRLYSCCLLRLEQIRLMFLLQVRELEIKK